MANDKVMTMDEAYTCPSCKCQEVVVEGMEQIFDDARAEYVRCLNCSSSWRVYYKMTELNRKVTNLCSPPEVATPESEMEDITDSAEESNAIEE